MTRRQRVAILGGGMAGLATAWRLSESGWTTEFESITVYQRGWRLGGKGASSRGVNGRIEEHGLHVWFGWYENALRLLQECYEELDRADRDPELSCADVERRDCSVWHDRVGRAAQRGLAAMDDGHASKHPIGHWTGDERA